MNKKEESYEIWKEEWSKEKNGFCKLESLFVSFSKQTFDWMLHVAMVWFFILIKFNDFMTEFGDKYI
jgi:hypothetical protein